MFGVQLHKLIIHFPIVLALVAFSYDAWASYSRNSRLHEVGSRLTMFAAASALIATATGFDLAGISGLGSGSTVTGHAGFGLVSTIVLLALAALRYSAEARANFPEKTYSGLWLGWDCLPSRLFSVTESEQMWAFLTTEHGGTEGVVSDIWSIASVNSGCFTTGDWVVKVNGFIPLEGKNDCF